MRTRIINYSNLEPASWKVERFLVQETKGAHLYRYALVTVGELIEVRKEPVDPRQPLPGIKFYIGMEHVESTTGEFLSSNPVPPAEVRSVSKRFHENDVLYARLRPTLNKVYLAAGRVSEGICSNEFLVLTPGTTVLPAFLRYMLSSPIVQSEVARKLAGATLPRINAADLLAIRIPLPPLEIQREIIKIADKNLSAYREAVEAVKNLPTQTMDHILSRLKKR